MPSRSSRKDRWAFNRQLALALELPFILVSSVVIGGGIGWLLDRWLHFSPWLTLLFGLLGFAGGMRELLRRLGVSGNGSGSDTGKNDRK